MGIIREAAQSNPLVGFQRDSAPMLRFVRAVRLLALHEFHVFYTEGGRKDD